MKTLDDALMTPGVIPDDYYVSADGSAIYLRKYGNDTVMINGHVAAETLRRIADHLDPQSVSAPVIPEGWRLVPVEPTDVMMDAGCRQSSHDSEWIHVYSAWKDMVTAAPPAPLRTEAEVRAKARREALKEAISAIPAGWDAGNGSGTRVITPDEAAAAIRALIEKEPT